MILGHAHIWTTLEIYTHVDEEARDDALTGLDELLEQRPIAGRLWSTWWSAASFKILAKVFCLVELWGFEPQTSCMPCKRSTN